MSSSSRGPLGGPQIALVAVIGVVAALVLGLLGGAVGLSIAALADRGQQAVLTVTESDREPELSGPETIAGVVRVTLPSVVSVVVDAGAESGSGSGFVLRSDGYLVTNNHVIDAAVVNEGTVDVVLNDGRRLSAEVIGRNRPRAILFEENRRGGEPASFLILRRLGYRLFALPKNLLRNRLVPVEDPEARSAHDFLALADAG